MKKIIICITIMLASLSLLNAQMNYNTPDLVLPSPDAAALGKYGQYPVSLSTGLVQIDIPIHIIDLPLISLPISISYHASGIKVDEISGIVGLGWSLNAGGVITRSVRGIPDAKFGVDDFKSVKFIDQDLGKNEDSKLSYLSLINRNDNYGSYDSETDIYYYNVAGLSGSFRFEASGKLVQIPLTNNKIEYLSDTDVFEITGDDGTIYTFQDREIVNSKGAAREHTTSWYISSIRTRDNKYMSFNYKDDRTYYQDFYVSHQLKIRQDDLSNNMTALNPRGNLVETTHTVILASINYPEGSVRFNHQTDRKGKRKYRLTGIDIINNKNKLVKAFSFTHNYFNYPANRLRLDKITLLDTDRSAIGDYDFSYNTDIQLPQYYNPSSMSFPHSQNSYFGQDLWGYYNGIQSNNHFLTYEPQSMDKIANYKQSKRLVDPQYTQACVLNGIIYPTGGRTEFIYEGNLNAFGENVGGLRIKNIISYPNEDSSPIVSSYAYEMNQEIISSSFLAHSSYSKGDLIPDLNPNFPPGGEIHMYNYHVSDPIVPLDQSAGAPVFYGKVIEYNGYPEKSNGKTEYFFNGYSNDIGQYRMPHCVMPNLLGNFITKLRYHYDNKSWRRGQVSSIDIYAKNNNVFSLLKRTRYEYKVFNKREFQCGFIAFSNFNPGDSRIIYGPYGRYGVNVNELYQYSDVYAETGLVKLAKTEEIDYLEGRTVAQSTSHSYDRLQNQYEVTTTTKSNSDGSTVKKTFQYPNDLKSSSSISKLMSDRNVISPVIIESEYIDNRFTQSVHTEYKSWPFRNFDPPHRWANTYITPYKVDIKRGAGVSETELTYEKYDDCGNILGVSRRGGINETIVWGYNWAHMKALPVAKLDNISHASVYSNSTLMGFLNQLQNYTSLNDVTTRNNLKTLNESIRKALPADVMVVTCTYTPLVGMTSMTDPNGITTYYDYDSFGRLLETYILDEGNKKPTTYYEYHYKNK